MHWTPSVVTGTFTFELSGANDNFGGVVCIIVVTELPVKYSSNAFIVQFGWVSHSSQVGPRSLDLQRCGPGICPKMALLSPRTGLCFTPWSIQIVLQPMWLF